MTRELTIGIVSLLLAATLIGQTAPRDANEAEAWQIYQEYKASRAAEAAASSAIRQVRNDVGTSSLSSIGVFGSDPGDRARLAQLRQTVDAERQRQMDLLKRWGSKFYWRYGDLVWSEERIRDAKTKREMDRIEFALTYIPFNYVPKTTAAASPTPAPVVTAAANSSSLTLELPGYWGHLSYTITGARLDAPTGGDRGKVAGRQYTGELIGPTLTVSGKAVSDNPSSGPGSMDYYEIVVSVTAGKEKKEYGYIAQKGEKLNKSFSLSVPVAPGSTGSFSISLLEQNANYGPHGWVVGGRLAASRGGTQTSTQPIAALGGTWACSDGGTYRIEQSGTSIKWEAASADGGMTWSHSFVGTIQGDKIVGRFEDHPSGHIRNRGDLTLRIVGGGKLEYVSSSVPFGGRVWSR